jgi:hypothetical protein
MKHEFDQAARPAVFQCDVCMEDLPSEQFPYQDVTERCNHDNNICQTCLSQSIAAQLDDKGWDQITCPTSSCAAKLSSNNVEMWAEPSTVTRYHRFMLSFALSADPNFRYCLRDGCQFGQVHESGTLEPYMRCGECYFEMCFVHRRAWHQSQSCAEYDEILRSNAQHQREESQSEVVIAQTSKACPGEGCEARIEKRDGCDHMTCKLLLLLKSAATRGVLMGIVGTRCRQEFCWQCLAPYLSVKTLGNAGHNTSCPYANATLPPDAILNPTRYLNTIG